MKLLLLILIFASVTPALADRLNLVATPKLLEYSTNNGSTVPRFQVSTSCEVYSNFVLKNEVRDGRELQPVYADLRWTRKVPNVNAVLALIISASHGQMTHRITRVRGTINRWKAFIPSQAESRAIFLRSYGEGNWFNESPEAEVLVQFLNRNCQ